MEQINWRMEPIKNISKVKNPENYLILIIEETKYSGMLFQYLHGYGFKVLMADDGESALTMTAMSNPDIILLDVALPGINGFETCRRLKAKENTKNIPVIFIASLANTVDKLRGFSLGAVDYITKPIQTEEVLARLKTHLTLQDLQRTLKENNARLREEIIQREKLIAELDSFAHTVAHDLKNPLGVTINYAHFLHKYSDGMDLDNIKQYSDVIFRNGHKMSNIIDELLLLASVRTEDVNLKPLDMAEIVDEAQQRLSYVIAESKAKLTLPDEWPSSQGYGPWVEEVWANYISNAVKYGGDPPEMELGATVHNNGTVQFWVHDNGAGLSPEDQSMLFIPFNRVTKTKVEGHGLGLSIVERIMKKLSGKVSVESEGIVGKGCIFSFYLLQTTD